MKDFKFIELPKEEILSEVELSLIEGASNCTNFSACTGSGKSSCGTYSDGQCTGNSCTAGLFCSNYTF